VGLGSIAKTKKGGFPNPGLVGETYHYW